MNKLEPDEKGLLSYDRAIAFLEAKYSFSSYDFLFEGERSSRTHFSDWCDKKGYGMQDPEGNHRNSSQIWFNEYSADAEGMATCPAPRNFWHWFLDILSGDGPGYSIPKKFTLNVTEILKNYDNSTAIKNAHKQASAAVGIASVLHMIPDEFKTQLVKQIVDMPGKLPDFVRVILGYFETEFGPKVKLTFPRE